MAYSSLEEMQLTKRYETDWRSVNYKTPDENRKKKTRENSMNYVLFIIPSFENNAENMKELKVTLIPGRVLKYVHTGVWLEREC